MTTWRSDGDRARHDGLFWQIVDMVIRRSPLQKKKLLQDLAGRGPDFFSDAEEFAKSYAGYLDSQGIPIEYAVTAYLEMCGNMMRCQIEFMKTGRYPVSAPDHAAETVYRDEVRMKSYMIGLAISQFLWRTHYEMFRCLRSAVARHCPAARGYLEIGPGHGLFLREAVAKLPPDARVVAVDISPVSIAITRSIMDHFFPGSDRVAFRTEDALLMDPSERFDFITMGEVLEHVSDPGGLLGRLRNLLTDRGRAFVSTCVNAPAIDHVHHFRSVAEIRRLIEDCGLASEEEHVLPVENLPMDEIVDRRIAINYCAIVGRKAA